MQFFESIREKMRRSTQVAHETGSEVAIKHVPEIVDFIERLVFCNVSTIRIVIEGYNSIRINGARPDNQMIHKEFFFEYDYKGERTQEQLESFRHAYCEQLKIELPEIEWKAPTFQTGVIAVIERSEILGETKKSE